MKCKKCKQENTNDSKFCIYCGKEMDNKTSSMKFSPFKVIVAFILLCLFAICGCKMYQYFANVNLNNKYKNIVKENINNNSSEIEFIERKPCIESYNTCAGDSGSGRREVPGCYVYFYDVKIDDLNTKYYYFVSDEQGNVYDELGYTKIGKELLNYKSQLGDFELKYLYYEVSDYSIDESLKNKSIILYYDRSMSSVVNKEFLDKYSEIVEHMGNKTSLNLSILLVFSDNYIIDYRYGHKDYEKNGCFFGGGAVEERSREFVVDKYSSLDEIKSDTCIHGMYSIYKNDEEFTEEIIDWCISNNKPSYEYKEEIND